MMNLSKVCRRDKRGAVYREESTAEKRKEENPDVLDDDGAEKKTDTKKSLTPPEQNTDDDIYKGLHPLVREKLEALEKRAEETEDRELYAVAKKYEIWREARRTG